MQSAPTDLRSTFDLFRYYRPDVGIRRLLDDYGVADMTPRQIYHAVHGRPPDTLEVALPAKNFDATTTFIAALSSVEFQANLASNLLRAFPEKRRIFFVHIPKTAGVDLATRFICRYPSINTNLLDRTLTPSRDQLLLAVKHITLEMACCDCVFISGHTHLSTYQSWASNGIRSQDKVFTVVREPLDRIISQVNYVLTRIFSTQTPAQPDTLGWRKLFGVDDLSVKDSRAQLLKLARRILRDKGVVVPNIACAYIGDGGYEAALAKTVAHDLEVIELKMLDAWTEERLGVTRSTRLNTSEKFVSIKEFSSDDLEYANSIVKEDMRYYQAVMAACERYGGKSVTGAQIAR